VRLLALQVAALVQMAQLFFIQCREPIAPVDVGGKVQGAALFVCPAAAGKGCEGCGRHHAAMPGARRLYCSTQSHRATAAPEPPYRDPSPAPSEAATP